MMWTLLLALALSGGAAIADAQGQERARVVIVIAANAECGPTNSAEADACRARALWRVFTHIVAGTRSCSCTAAWAKWPLLRRQSCDRAFASRPSHQPRQLRRGRQARRTVPAAAGRANRKSTTTRKRWAIPRKLSRLTRLELGSSRRRLPLSVRRATIETGNRDLVSALLTPLVTRFPDVAAAEWESGAIDRGHELGRTRLLIMRMVSDLVNPVHGEAQG